MQRFLLTILLAASLVGLVKAQEATRDTAEEVKKEIMKIEEEKESALEKGASAQADWFERYNADDLDETTTTFGVRTKAQVLVDFRSGNQKNIPVSSYDYRVRVHGNGNTAILTYRVNNIVKREGKAYAHEQFVSDVYVKEGGVWQRVVHHSSPVPTHQLTKSNQ